MAFGKTHKFSDAWDLQEGQVESIDDPKNSRRVKVRVYDLHGKLDENNGEPTTEELPWARVVMPVTASGGTFTSSSTHNLKVGDFVLVKFSKGDTSKPLVIGCVDAGVACASEKKPESLGKYCKPFEKAVYQDQKNGNNQLNSVRNEFNDRLKRKLFMGSSSRVTWTNYRRFRTI